MSSVFEQVVLPGQVTEDMDPRHTSIFGHSPQIEKHICGILS